MYNWLFYSDTYMPLLALVTYLLLWNKIGKKELILFYYLALNVVLFYITNVMAQKGIHNVFLYHFYSLTEMAIISFYILRGLLGKSLKLVISLVAGYFILWILNILFLEPLTQFNSNSLTLTNFLLLLLAMYYMLELSKKDEILYFQRLPTFWIVSGFLVGCAISTLSIVAYRFFTLQGRKSEGELAWVIVAVAIIIKFALITIGLLCYKRPRHYTRHSHLLL